jgi:putative ABC transport system permease protein
MFRNHLKIAFRNLVRNKVFSFINVVGLATGLSICLLIMLYIFDEVGYDKHHKQADNLYRIAFVAGNGDTWTAAAAPVAWSVKADLPEVEQATRLLKLPNVDKLQVSYTTENNERKSFFETNGYYVDSTFFELFTYDFVYGATNALNQPNSLVISATLSKKLFGKENPIGKPVTLGLPFGESTYNVQGVFRDNKNKSHIPASFFMSMRNSDFGDWVSTQSNWAMQNIFYTYVRLKPGMDEKSFERKLDAYYQQRAYADLKAQGLSKHLFIQPVKDIYLHSNSGYEVAPNGNIKYLYILGSIAAFILFIACINFMNLSTARSSKRAKEVGVRKVIGAEKSSLVLQFLGESFMLCLMALVLALLLTTLLLPLFNQLTQKELHLSNQRELILALSGLTIGTGLLAGLYPAFYLSSFKPVSVLKGKILNSFSATAIRKGLVVFQFTVSVVLILGAIVIGRQLHYMKNQPLGFNKQQQIVLPMPNKQVAKNYTVLKNELLKNRHIKTVTSGSTYPGIQNITDLLFYGEGKTNHEQVDIHLASIEDDYFETFGLQLLHGRTFYKNSEADSASLIFNETAVKDLGYKPAEAIGKKVHYDFMGVHYTRQIVGVVKDFHFESLHYPIRPFGFGITGFFGNKYTYAVVNAQSGNYASLLADMEKTWSRINPGTPFEYSFLDKDFQRNYEKEQRTSTIVIYFTCMAIFIACLGLFGLAAFSAEQRTREIGVRKVLGASVSRITLLLTKDFIGLVLIGICIASPIAWFGMTKWLQNFHYRIEISWWMFVAAGCGAIVIALLTVSVQAIKAAIANPVKALRSE